MELSTLHKTIDVVGNRSPQRSLDHMCNQDSYSSGHDSAADAFASITMMPIYTPHPSLSFRSHIPFCSQIPTNTAGAYDMSTPKRRQLYTEAEWNQIRPVFEKLYSTPGFRLVDVQRTMSDEHGFHATISMYKKHITKWRLAKNTKAALKNAIIEDLRSKTSNGVSGAGIDMKLLHKTIRHAQELRNTRKMSSASYEKFLAQYQIIQRSSKAYQRFYPNEYSEESPLSISLAEVAHNSPKSSFNINTMSKPEILFLATKDSTMLMITYSSTETGRTSVFSKPTTRKVLRQAYDYLRLDNYSRARYILASIGDVFEDDLRNYGYAFLPWVVQTLKNWNENRADWRDAVYQYFVYVSSKLLGAQNPVTLLLKMLGQLSDTADIYIRMFRCMLDTLMTSNNNTSLILILSIQGVLISELVAVSDFEKALHLVEDYQDRLSQVLDLDDGDFTMAMWKVLFFQQQGMQQKVLEVLQEAFQVAQRCGEVFWQFEISDLIANFYEMEFGDIDAARLWYKSTLEIMADERETEEFVTKRLVVMQDALEMFQEYNAVDEYQDLIEEYPEIYHSLLESTDNKRAWLTGQKCSLGRPDCICQGNFVLDGEEDFMDIQESPQEDDNAWLVGNAIWKPADHD